MMGQELQRLVDDERLDFDDNLQNAPGTTTAEMVDRDMFTFTQNPQNNLKPSESQQLSVGDHLYAVTKA